MRDEGFHPGELLAQRRAGACDDARRLGRMLTDPAISAGMGRFIAEREQVYLTSIDDIGRLWTSALPGPPGFCDGHDRRLIIAARPTADDPLRSVGKGRPAGVLFVDFARRRRLRVNGVVVGADTGGLEISVEQAFGNCPRYIHQSQPDRCPAWAADHVFHRSTRLDADDVTQIAGADTFILGTRHPERGADTSHRGGTPGFVRVVGGELRWPDYPGNNLFNTIGNLLVNPAASLLFLDHEHGRTLQISGRAEVDWSISGAPGVGDGTGRSVRLTPAVVNRSSAIAAGRPRSR